MARSRPWAIRAKRSTRASTRSASRSSAPGRSWRWSRPVRDGRPSANRALRDIGRGLAPARDRAVAREALARVSKQLARSGRASKLGPRLRRHLSADGAEARLQDAAGDLADARRAVRRLRVTHGRRAVASGFEGAYRRARRAFRDVGADDDVTLFHRWRKIVKRLGYQVALLGDAASSSFGALEPLLDRLGKLLGDLHDVAFLRAAVAEVGAERDLRSERDRWLAFLDARARDLRGEARALGIPLFAEPPSTLRRRVESDWSRWRS